MNKKSQVYILAAFIIVVAVFGIITQANKLKRESIKERFQELAETYDRESRKVINNIIANNIDPTTLENDLKEGFKDFTKTFIQNYALNQDPSISLAYVFGYKDLILIQNYLKELSEGGGDDLIVVVGDNKIGLHSCELETSSSASALGIIFYSQTDVPPNYCTVEINLDEITTDEIVIENHQEDNIIEYVFEAEERQFPELLLVLRKAEEGSNIVEVYLNEKGKKEVRKGHRNEN